MRAVLGMLRNRTYLGEVSFQGTHYPAPHEPLVDKDLFERVQEILGERSEDISLRRSNQSEYLLTGLVKCARCGKRYLGASANGNGGRYRYYVCFSRQRYGKKACEGERLPADQLEEAILGQLLAVLEREPVVREAISEAFAELDADQPKREAELERIGAERCRTSESLERYFRAFEDGTMPESACAPRIGELSEKLCGLEARREELAAEEPSEREPLTDEDLALLQAEVREVIEDGDPPMRKALLQSLVDEIRVVSRAEIFPSFSLPAVRPPQRAVPLIGALSKSETTARLARLAKLRKKLLSNALQTPQPPASPPHRIGEISRAIVETLRKAGEPMHVSDIHRSVERLLGRAVNPRSVRGRLSEGALLRKPRFQRTNYGHYRLTRTTSASQDGT